jgi:YVTN family beta-propeller protein
MTRFARTLLPIAIAATLPIHDLAAQVPYTNFESTVVHPVRVTADGQRLVAVVPSSDRLAVFSLSDPLHPLLLREVPVGLRPASVTMRTASEAWVANLLSDSISVVDIDTGLVLATLRTGDEPSDIAFAAGKAFVTAATRDQVQVFDATTRVALGAVDVFGKEPRALAVDPSGQRIWALSRRSGNGTTLLKTTLAPAQPAPTNPALPAAPQTGLIVRAADPAWAPLLPFTLPDRDVFEIDAVSQTVVRSFSGIGTTNFDLAVHPLTGALLVANSDARNLVRFVPALRGHVVDHRLTTIAPGTGSVTPFDLNAGIDYTTLPNPAALTTALADPTGLALDASRELLYVAAQGTDRIGVLDLLAGQIVARIEMSGTAGTTIATTQKRGPRAMALHPSGQWLYVWNRLSESLAVIDTVTRTLVDEGPLGSHDAEPSAVRTGRRYLYDAKLSGNGTISCASCHIDGEEDGLAWDLGDPTGSMTAIPVAFQQGAIAGGPPPANFPAIHPMKGPLMTQPLRDLQGRPHWRGDLAGFADFNATFPSLMGGALLTPTAMAQFTQWSTSVRYPPNPNQNLDRTRTTQQQQGLQAFSNGAVSCISCHTLPTGSNGFVRDTPQGTNQPMKIAPLRNYYRKSGLSKSGGQPLKMGFGLFKDGEAGVLQDINMGGVGGTGTPPMAQFLLAFDTGTAPIVGFQVQVDVATQANPTTWTNVGLLEARAIALDCDVVVHGQFDGAPASWRFERTAGVYLRDRSAVAPSTRTQLQQFASAGRLTAQWVAVAPGEGLLAIDRDQDGVLDGDARAQSYGTASGAACSQSPRLAGSSEPQRGNGRFALVGDRLAANDIGLLGVSAATGSVPLLGVDVWIAIDPSLVLLTVLSDARGTGPLALPIPDDPALVGASLFAQMLALQPCSGGFAASPGLRITVQP